MVVVIANNKNSALSKCRMDDMLSDNHTSSALAATLAV
jgi:hypothetical protein